MHWIIVSFLIVMFSLGSQALTEQQLRTLLDTTYSSGPPAMAAKKFAQHYKIPLAQAERLLIFHRTQTPKFKTIIKEVLDLLNEKEGAPLAQETSPPALGASSMTKHFVEEHREHEDYGDEGDSSASHHIREHLETAEDAEQSDRTLREKLQREEEEARAMAIERSREEADQERRARKATEDRKRQAEEIDHWLQHTLLIGESRAAVGGFDKVKDRLDIFNPLYGDNFKAHGIPPKQRKVFPNVPIVHQYDPQASSGGGYFPLVIKLPPIFLSLLPKHIQTHFKPVPDCELYWVVQLIGSLSGTGRGVKDNIVFRPQYWVQPNGAPIAFKADVHLLDTEGHYLHLPPTGYSIHDGVASPNAPVIPFQKRLQSGETISFWSLVKHGKREAVSCHWILNDDDMIPLGRAIEASATLQELLINLRKNQHFFSKPPLIDEIEAVFGQR